MREGYINDGLKLSIIIPVFNTEKYLKKCLDSVLCQTLKDIEIICINDGSTDGSLEILREYEKKDERIKVLTQENKSAGAARNRGLEIAKGEYLGFLDSDDFFEADFCELMYSKAVQNNDDIVICPVMSYDTNTGERSRIIWSLKEGQYPLKDVFNKNDMPKYIFGFAQNWNWNKIFKREFISKNNIKFQELFRTNDLYFTCAASVLAERMSIVYKPLVNYRIGTKTNSQSTNRLYPTDFLDAFLELKKFLVAKELYKGEIKQSFINWALGGVVYNIGVQGSKALEKKLIKQIFPKCLYELDLADLKPDYVYNKSQLTSLKKYINWRRHAFFYWLFSLIKSDDKTHKVLTIFGIKFSFRIRKPVNV